MMDHSDWTDIDMTFPEKPWDPDANSVLGFDVYARAYLDPYEGTFLRFADLWAFEQCVEHCAACAELMKVVDADREAHWQHIMPETQELIAAALRQHISEPEV